MADSKRVVRSAAARSRGAADKQIQGDARTTTQFSRRKDVVSETTKNLDSDSEAYFPPGVEPAFVRVSVGSTINLGNFESLRLDVSITLPCRVEDVDETYSKASDFVQEKLQEEESIWLAPPSKNR